MRWYKSGRTRPNINYKCRGTNPTHSLELIILCMWKRLFGIERDWVKTTGKDQEEEDSSEPTLVPASGSFKSGWASWGCNVPLITQALGNYATGFTLASQSHRRACGFTHGHLKASAHSFFLEVDFFLFRTSTRSSNWLWSGLMFYCVAYW